MILLRNVRLVDGTADQPRPVELLIDGGTVRELSDGAVASAGAEVVDGGGRVVMPGLIDCHVHVIAGTADLALNALLPDSLVAARAAVIMRGMLHRGFTTVRDVGGADWGLKQAQAEGAIEGPRLVISGKALSQTGGHTDSRGRWDRRDRGYFDRQLGSLGRLVDGVPEVRRACREEIKEGADFIKVMANGGVSSPTDPIAFLGFSREELSAAVEEAANADTYVSAHLYTDAAIRRAVELGVHSVEHANLIEPGTARLAAERGATVVPTLVTFEALKEEGASLGLPPVSVAKVDDVRLRGLQSLDILQAAGVTLAYGTDLLGEMHRHQSREFTIRAQVLPPRAVLASALGTAARLLRMEDRIGTLAPGAHADLLLLDGNPLDNLAVLTDPARMPGIMQAGRWVRRAF